MAIRKYRADDDDLGWPFGELWPLTALWLDREVRVYNPLKYDLVPRQEFKKELLTKKEAELKELQEKQEKIKQEINELKK